MKTHYFVDLTVSGKRKIVKVQSDSETKAIIEALDRSHFGTVYRHKNRGGRWVNHRSDMYQYCVFNDAKFAAKTEMCIAKIRHVWASQ